MAADTPARLVGKGGRRGGLASGYDAAATILSPELSVEAVYRGGSRVYSADG
jgi:N-acetylglucosamine-6-phosphate deacetylase